MTIDESTQQAVRMAVLNNLVDPRKRTKAHLLKALKIANAVIEALGEAKP